MKLLDLLKTLPATPTNRGPLITFDTICSQYLSHGRSADALVLDLRALEEQGLIKIENLNFENDKDDVIVGISIVK